MSESGSHKLGFSFSARLPKFAELLVSIREVEMPKPELRPSARSHPEIADLTAENERLRMEVANLKAQIATIHAGIRAVLDGVAPPKIEWHN